MSAQTEKCQYSFNVHEMSAGGPADVPPQERMAVRASMASPFIPT